MTISMKTGQGDNNSPPDPNNPTAGGGGPPVAGGSANPQAGPQQQQQPQPQTPQKVEKQQQQPVQHDENPGGMDASPATPPSAASTNTGGDGNPAGGETTNTTTTTITTTVVASADAVTDATEFPTDALAKLDEMISRPRWVVPVLPKGELEVLLESSIALCKKDLDTKSEACQRFFRDGLTVSFTKILTDEAVSGWKFEIHRCIMENCKKLIELCVQKLDVDWFPLLELLAMAFNPHSKFHTYNGNRISETVPSDSNIAEDELFARPKDTRNPTGWMVDLVNLFGTLGGFQKVLDRFTKSSNLSVAVIAALIRPFGYCYEVLTPHTVQKYFFPAIEIVQDFLEKLPDEELKKESKTEAKNDALSGIIKALKVLTGRVQKQEEKIKCLEKFRLKMILRLLQISSFNGKMNALNEVNKVLTNVTYYPHRHGQMEEEDWLTAEKMAEWIEQNNVLDTVLRDSLHQPQYVEKLEKIVRFMIKEKALTPQDLDKIWNAQAGKHEAIVKNVHDLLAKLAWDFSPEQLDHLFECFQKSWTNASKKQREKLLELIRRLAEDDKEGIMANKVLGLLWNLAHSDDVPTEIMDQALTAHIKILDYSASQDREAQKMQWINKFVEELKNEKWVLPALKQIREICQLFSEAPQNYSHTQRSPHIYYRNHVINNLQQQHSIVMLVAQNLTAYMNKMRDYAKENPDADPAEILPDGRFNHVQQVQERLKFLRFLLKDGQLWLCEPQAKQIWICLAVNAVYDCDRENCFKWFSKLMGEETDLDPEILKDFLEQNILQFDPQLLTENGMNCFERFFKTVNSREGKLMMKRRGGFMMDSLDLVGIEYLWRVVLYSSDEVCQKGISLLREIYTNLGPRLTGNTVAIHDDFINDCHDRLRAAFDTISALDKDKDSVARIELEAGRMVRVLTVLREYVAQCDESYGEERAILPLDRACRGKHLTLLVRFPNQGRQSDDFDIWSHQSETVGSLRRQVMHRVKANNANLKLDLFFNNEQIEHSEDRKLLSQIGIKDKMLLTAKLSQIGSNMPSSPESSSDSSTGGSPHHLYDGPNIEAESCLPGVLMANNKANVVFLYQVYDLGCHLQINGLRDCVRMLLKLLPADIATTERLRTLCAQHAKQARGAGAVSPELEAIFFGQSPAQVLYTLEVCYSMLMPAQSPMNEEAFEFQYNFLKSGGVTLVLNMLTKNNFIPTADLQTRRSVYLVVLKMCKLLLTAVGHANVQVVVDALHTENTTVTPQVHNQAVILQQALQHVPNPNAECMTRNVAAKLGQQLAAEITSVTPDVAAVKAIQKIAWSSSTGSLGLVHATMDEMHQQHSNSQAVNEADSEDIQVCREALEVLTVCLALYPMALDILNKDKHWQAFIIDILLLCKSRAARSTGTEQFLMMATRCSAGARPLLFFITLLFTVLGTTAKDNAKQSQEYFQLFCRLLSFACASQVQLSTHETLLNNEIVWLKKVRDSVLKTGELDVEESLLEGHLGVTKELLQFQTPEKKYHIGSEKGGANLIKELVEDFIFPASKIVLQCRKTNCELPSDQAIPVCSTQLTMVAAFDLLVALCTGCIQNLKALSTMLLDMYYSSFDVPVMEWEYLPPIGPRPPKGFVGLKNAGATCYMNSVLQQLCMVEPIRTQILSIDGVADENMDDYDVDEKQEQETNVDLPTTEEDQDKTTTSPQESSSSTSQQTENKMTSSKTDERKDYNMTVLKHVQVIFAHLACSKLQYYVPRGFWKHFRLQGEPVNLREQHDALEFFTSLVDSLDEALKSLSYKPIFTRVMGGSFADQKICKGCPHRYSREESFLTLSIDIRNQHNLLESLEQYVKGDLLEGANAYHCDKCDKKVDTVKRMCIKKLPAILAIQLKRFDYDWERECAIKFNDYFEFPREFDMEPYTVRGLAKIEGEVISDDGDEPDKLAGDSVTPGCNKYKLVGVVVHSGQASGGHYYAFILNRSAGGQAQWYKFDDGEVTECKMDDDEEMKNQCFGGEYLGELFDHMTKRMSYRKQKRWWNAYILMYEKMDANIELSTEKQITKSLQDLTIDNRTSQVKMPVGVERCVRKQNIQFMHNKTQFSGEYFTFIKKLLHCNQNYVQIQQGSDKLSAEAEELSMISVDLGSKFLFNVALHTKKNLRGSANDWYDALSLHLRHSAKVRNWFAQNVLFTHPSRFSEYLLECPSTEVRNAFMKIIVFIAHFSREDGPLPSDLTPVVELSDPSCSLSDHLLSAVLALLKREVSEHGRHLPQYFHLFLMYANLGIPEKLQLLKLNVPHQFMQVALDEGPGPPIKYQYAELGKLYSVVSQLIRCCDVSTRCQASNQSVTPMRNPNGDPNLNEPLMPLQTNVTEILFSRTSYVKKLLEDCNNSEETAKLLKFCSWENPHFSSTVLSELLWQVAYSYTYELRPYLDLLLQMLLLEDSWQNHRIHNALKGIPDDRDGLFDTIQRSKSHYQKRAYQCIKMMVSLFTHCARAAQMLQSNSDLKKKWTYAVEWLHDELDRRPYGSNTQYAYNNWSPPAQSNETSNGYFLERSHSARMTLAKAVDLCPDEEPEEGGGAASGAAEAGGEPTEAEAGAGEEGGDKSPHTTPQAQRSAMVHPIDTDPVTPSKQSDTEMKTMTRSPSSTDPSPSKGQGQQPSPSSTSSQGESSPDKKEAGQEKKSPSPGQRKSPTGQSDDGKSPRSATTSQSEESKQQKSDEVTEDSPKVQGGGDGVGQTG